MLSNPYMPTQWATQSGNKTVLTNVADIALHRWLSVGLVLLPKTVLEILEIICKAQDHLISDIIDCCE